MSWRRIGCDLGPVTSITWEGMYLYAFEGNEDTGMEYEIRHDDGGYWIVAAHHDAVGLVTYYEINADNTLTNNQALDLIYAEVNREV